MNNLMLAGVFVFFFCFFWRGFSKLGDVVTKWCVIDD